MYDLARSRPNTRWIFSGIGFRTWSPPVPKSRPAAAASKLSLKLSVLANGQLIPPLSSTETARTKAGRGSKLTRGALKQISHTEIIYCFLLFSALCYLKCFPEFQSTTSLRKDSIKNRSENALNENPE
ncbi:hypothetical protein AVEN_157968-1 [Araneus ventricosus]|uniref:Uncharacterized protein n=1 Tax=Araneus ventricosus TaxID=182803 RepID=A0A4Y2N9X2_ARAVE|nr:hypothetical protein AVEN_157968-1 [Araneus ventricosus]